MRREKWKEGDKGNVGKN